MSKKEVEGNEVIVISGYKTKKVPPLVWRECIKKVQEVDPLFCSHCGGGIDTQKTLPQGTPDEVEEEVKRAMDIMGPGGGFVFGPVHRIQADVPIENMIRFFQAVERYRQGSHYCYSK